MDSFEVALRMLHDALERVGHVELINSNADPDTPQSLLTYTPDPAKAELRQRLGLLGLVAGEPCCLVAFQGLLGIEEVLEAHRQHLNLDHDRCAGDPRRASTLWIVTSKQPRTVTRGLGLIHVHNQPRGVYTAAPGLRLRLIVLEELEVIGKTLFWRLMGHREVLALALDEVLALPPKRWERSITLPLLQAKRAMIAADPSERSRDDEDFLYSTHPLDELVEEGLELPLELPSSTEGLEAHEPAPAPDASTPAPDASTPAPDDDRPASDSD